MKKILIIDDEREVGNFFCHLLEEKGYSVKVGLTGEDFQTFIQNEQFDLALIDVKLPDTNGLELLKQLKAVQPSCKAVIMTGYSTVKTAVEAIKKGASDYIEKPFDDIFQLEQTLENLLSSEENAFLPQADKIAGTLGFVIGNNKEMNDLVKLATKIAKKNINVLIEGETGTGKDVLAHFIHQMSLRYDQPFIRINCGAVSETLLESELFGHEKGAFTGAIKQKKGIFEVANNGTLFLDEIGEASQAIQVKLLRVLESGEYMRVGGESIRKTNTRIIAATNKDLGKAVQEKTFREDLLYRLDVVKLRIPPLRKRIEDLPLYLDYFLKKLGATHLTFSDECLLCMKNYAWPGNMRELFNIVKRAVTLADGETNVITTNYLPDKLKTNLANDWSCEEEKLEDLEAFLTEWAHHIITLWKQEDQMDLETILSSVKEVENQIGRLFVMKMLKKYAGNRKQTAEALNISMRKLKYILNEKGKCKV